ncbi:MAG: exodeoxyribonuclease VII large subunit [Gammaproteobacteria bacterium]|nr:MAG: exodeoxyribonuclease VII large subunit [Gammaproteobacteria bacterium]
MNNKIWQVSDFLNQISSLITDKYRQVNMQAEISSIRVHSSGHIYLTLKDKKSQVNCVMFLPDNRRLKFNPQIGDMILIVAIPNIYIQRGDFSLIIKNMQPFGEGQLQREFEKLKLKLKNEGLFDNIHKKTLPKSIRSIALISSPTGAAIKDVIKVFKERAKWIKIVIYPTAVQGNAASLNIIQQIENSNKKNREDIIMLTRGGGGYEDLQSFNDENLARAIFKSEIPVITGIGHQSDTTIADIVADILVPTPSASILIITHTEEQIIENFAKLSKNLYQSLLFNFQKKRGQKTELDNKLHQQKPIMKFYHNMQKIDYNLKSLQDIIQHKIIRGRQQDLIQLNNKLSNLKPITLIYNNIKKIEQNLIYLKDTINKNIYEAKNKIKNNEINLFNNHPKNKVKIKKQQSNNNNKNLQDRFNFIHQQHKNNIKRLDDILSSLNPYNILQRGYAIVITKKDNKPILRAHQTPPKTNIIIKFSDGKIEAVTD